MPDLRDNSRNAPVLPDASALGERSPSSRPASAPPSPPSTPPWVDPLAAPPGQLAGFWVRIFAAIADTILLAILGWLIARNEYAWLVDIGQYGRLIGLAITLVYFSAMNSALAGGATIGKYIFGIRVVGRDGEPVPFDRALLRTIVYIVPFYLDGVEISFLSLDQTGFMVATALDAAIIFGGIGTIIYLYMVNARTRQSLHDLAAGTFVVRARAVHAPLSARIFPAHLIVVLFWFLLFLVGIPLGARYAMSTPWAQLFSTTSPEAKKIKSAVNADPSVADTTVIVVNAGASSLAGTSFADFVNVSVRLRVIPNDPAHVVDEVARRVLVLAPDLFGSQRLNVVVRYGYDIGIRSDWRTYSYSGTPTEWRSKLQQDEGSKPI